MSKRNGSMPKVLVTDSDRGSAIAIIRSLGRKGYRLVAADSVANSLGFHSKFAHEKVTYPAPETHPDEFCEFMLKTVESLGVDLVIPVTDLAIQPLTRIRAKFVGKAELAIPENKLLAYVTDKDKTVELAKKLGVPVPLTHTVSTAAEALEKAEELGWPVVLKPKISRVLHEGVKIEKFSVTYAGGPADLETQMKKLEGRCSVLLQRYLRGTGHGVELLMLKGEPIAAFQHKRLREVPVTGGPSCYREAVRLHEDLYDYSVRLLGELGWTGLAMVEFKVGEDRAELMEINGRVWGSLPLAVASGVDFPGLLTDMYLNGVNEIKPNLDSNYQLGLKCRDLGRDLMWMFSVLTRKRKYPFLDLPDRSQVLPAFLSLFNPRNKFDLLTFSDPMPGLVDLPRIYQKFLSKRRNGSSED